MFIEYLLWEVPMRSDKKRGARGEKGISMRIGSMNRGEALVTKSL